MSDLNNLNQLSHEKRALLLLRALELRQQSGKAAAEHPIARLPRRDGVNVFPASSAQERLWFLDQLMPDSSAYNLSISLRLRGQLAIEALQESLNEMLARHEALRTNLITRDGRPAQLIAPRADVKLREVDLRHLPADQIESVALRIVSEEAKRPFNLETDLLLRALVLRVGEHDQVVSLVVHHVNFDEWSGGIFVREVAALYEAFTHGQPSPLPELEIQYADYAAWQRQWLEGDAYQAQLDYWTQQLGGTLPVLELPTDRPRPVIQTSRGTKYFGHLSEQLSGQLRALSQQEGVTLFMALLTAFEILLYRYTGQEEILIGTPFANRSRGNLERLIGFFVNLLILRTDLAGATSFSRALARVRETTLKAYANQGVPFEKLIQQLQPERDLSRHQPFFQVSFSLQNIITQSVHLEAIEIMPFSGGAEVETFEDLNLVASDAGGRINLTVEYNTDLFDAETIRRFLAHYETLLQGIVAAPHSDLATLSLLPAAERRQVLYEWNETRADFSGATCLHTMFEDQAEKTQDVVAVVFEQQYLSYRELNREANRLAHHLSRLGAGPEAVVGICMDRTPEMVVAVLAALKAGCAYLMLDPTHPRERLAYMVEDASVRFALTRRRLWQGMPAGHARVVCVDSDRGLISQESDENPRAGAAPENLSYIIFTSGSTGRPKGIGLPHVALTNLIAWHLLTISQAARTIQFSSLSFDVSIHEIFSTCASGGTLFLIPESLRTDLSGLVQFVAEREIEKLNLPVVALQRLAEEYGERAELFASLNDLCVAGEQPTITRHIAGLFRRLKNCKFHNHYGPSETHVATSFTASHPPEAWPVLPPIGRPISNTQLYVLDAGMQPVPIGGIGEVYIAGICLARGYLNRQELTAEKFIPDPFSQQPGARLYKTGDLARYLPDGNIKFLGRADHQVKIRGFRVELGEVETVIGQHPAVRDVVVIARQDAPGEKRLVGYVIPAKQPACSVTELRRFVLEKLPDYMVPSAFVMLERFPQLPSGKVDRRQLPAPEPMRPTIESSYVAPRTPVEQALADIWSQVLRIDRVGVNDNFIELGGDSILSFQVVSRANRAGLGLTLKQFYDHPSIAESALVVDTSRSHHGGQHPLSAQRSAAAWAEQLPAWDDIDDAYPLSPLQQGMLFHSIYAPEAGEYVEVVSFDSPQRLHAGRFEQAWQQVIKRHPVLRTAFRWEEVNEPLQIVYKEARLPLDHHDWRRLAPAEQERELELLIRDEQRRDFDLSNGPLMHLCLLQLDDELYQFTWSYKHIILDGWSQRLVLQEVSRIYTALSAGQPIAHGSTGKYRDYIEWLQRQDLAQAKAYWRHALGELTTPTMLDGGGVHHAEAESYRELNCRLTEKATAALQRLARRHHLTINTVMLGVWALLLSRYSGDPEVVFGNVVNGRSADLDGAEEIVGLFINTLPVRVTVDEQKPVVEWLKGLQAEQVEARQYEYSPLVEVQKLSAMPRGTPLFESVLVLGNYPEADSISWPFVDRSLQRTGYPLHILIEPGPPLSLKTTYAANRFTPARVERLLRHLLTLMEDLPARSQEPLYALSLLSPQERQELLVSFNDTKAELPLDLCFHQHFEAQAGRTPDAIGVAFDSGQITYQGLNDRANQIAHRLVAQGAGPDDVVALFCDRGSLYLIGLLGIFKAGGAYLPLDPGHPSQRLSEVLGQSGASWVLYTHDSADALRQALDGVAEERLPRALSLEEVLEREPIGGNLPARSTPANLAYVIYTSGSTGTPKGAMVEQKGMLNHLYAKVVDLQLTSADVIAQTASQCFDISVWQFLAALLVGGRTHIISDEVVQDPAHLIEQVKSCHVSLLETVPSLLRMIVEEAANQQAPADLGALRWMIATGEALPPELSDRWFGLFPEVPLLNAYGPTECSDDVSHYAIYEPTADKIINMPIGRPVANTQLYVLDKRLRPVPEGLAGELVVGGEGVGRGYRNDPQRTATAFIPDPFSDRAGVRLYKTGDQARYLLDGNLEFIGRLDHQVKIRGYRIELGEVEFALSRHPDVSEVIVVAREDNPGERRMVAYLIARQESHLTTDGLRAFMSERVPDYMLPAAFVILDVMPKTANGKIDRKRLPAPHQGPSVEEHAGAGPRNQAERALAEIWAETLGVSRVGINDNFFHLGGDSILSIQVVVKASRKGLRLSPMDIFTHQTIAELAEVTRMAEAVKANGETISGPVTLTPIQHWFFEQEMAEPHHWNQSVLLEAREALDAALVKRAIDILVAHHESLRSRFIKGESGWRQVIADNEEAELLADHDLSALPSQAARTLFMEEAAARLQASLDLSQGPLVRAALFNLGPKLGSRLLIVIHHLVVDGVSWRILLEDLQAVYRQLSEDAAVEIAPPPTSYRQWAVRLAEYARSEEISQELGYWLATSEPAPLPVDYTAGINTVASARNVYVQLTAEETHRLLHEVSEAYHTQINDLLLAALLLTIGKFTNSYSLYVYLEGHGREHIGDNIDVSRTVGWFTSLFPVSLSVQSFSDPGDLLKAVKEQLRGVPRKGLGYGLLRYLGTDKEAGRRLRAMPQPQVSFNYLGQFDQVLPSSSGFAFAQESAGPNQSPQAERACLLDVTALVTGQRLRVNWTFSENVHDRTTVEEQAQVFLDSLRWLMAHCLSAAAGGRTPSDFPHAGLNQRGLDQVINDLNAHDARVDGLKDIWSQVEDIYRLSPLQQGLLFQLNAAPKAGAYSLQLTLRVEGNLDTVAFIRALRQVIARHSILRTSFHWEKLDESVQVVHRRIELPVIEQDWREWPEREQQSRLAAYLETDHARSFDVTRAPLMRVALLRMSENVYEVVWNWHHLILDGWSFSLLLNEIKVLYGARQSEPEARLSRARPFRDYIEWLEQQDLAQAEAYWRRTLGNLTAPTVLVAADGHLAGSDSATHAERRLELSEETTAAMRRFAQQHHLTLNTLILGAWGLLLSRYSGEQTVVFGGVVSGRSAKLPGVEGMVGVFVNTLPVRLLCDPKRTVLDWLNDLQAEQAEARQYEYTPLVEVQRCSGVPLGTPLFQSILVFENVVTPSPSQTQDSDIQIRDPRVEHKTTYPLHISAEPGPRFLFRMAYLTERFSESLIAQVLQHLERLIEGVIADPHQRLAEVSMSSSAEQQQLLADWNDLEDE